MFCYPSQYTNAKYLNAEFKKVRKKRWKNWRKKISNETNTKRIFSFLIPQCWRWPCRKCQDDGAGPG